MNVRFINSGERKKIISELKEKYGISDMPYLLFQTGQDKIRGFSGSVTKEEILELAGIANVEIIGIYMIRKEEHGGLRLSFDATQLLQDEIHKNVLEVGKEEYDRWMKGDNLEIVKERGMWIIKYGDDYLGCGISDGKKIINFVPKEKRARK